MKFLWSALCPLVFGLVLLLNGCASNPPLSGVNVTITELRPTSGLDVGMALNFVNENVIPIAVSGGTYSLFVDGTLVGKSINREAIGLPQQSTGSISVTLTATNAATLEKLKAGSSVNYQLDSVLRVDAGDSHLTLKNSSNGSAAVEAAK